MSPVSYLPTTLLNLCRHLTHPFKGHWTMHRWFVHVSMAITCSKARTATLHIALNIVSWLKWLHGPAWQETHQCPVSKDWKQFFDIHIEVCESPDVSISVRVCVSVAAVKSVCCLAEALNVLLVQLSPRDTWMPATSVKCFCPVSLGWSCFSFLLPGWKDQSPRARSELPGLWQRDFGAVILSWAESRLGLLAWSVSACATSSARVQGSFEQGLVAAYGAGWWCCKVGRELWHLQVEVPVSFSALPSSQG